MYSITRNDTTDLLGPIQSCRVPPLYPLPRAREGRADTRCLRRLPPERWYGEPAAREAVAGARVTARSGSGVV
jgi:hypothetical protein